MLSALFRLRRKRLTTKSKTTTKNDSVLLRLCSSAWLSFDFVEDIEHLMTNSELCSYRLNEVQKIVRFRRTTTGSTTSTRTPQSGELLRGIRAVPLIRFLQSIERAKNEAAPRIELGVKDLQSSALPLGHATIFSHAVRLKLLKIHTF